MRKLKNANLLVATVATVGLTACSTSDTEETAQAEPSEEVITEEPLESDSPDEASGGLFPGFEISDADAEALSEGVDAALAESLGGGGWDIVSMDLQHIGNGVFRGDVARQDSGQTVTISCIVEVEEGSTPDNVTLSGHMCPAP